MQGTAQDFLFPAVADALLEQLQALSQRQEPVPPENGHGAAVVFCGFGKLHRRGSSVFTSHPMFFLQTKRNKPFWGVPPILTCSSHSGFFC